MGLWLIEARECAANGWTVVTTEQEEQMACAVEAELERDGYEVRARPFGELPAESAQELLDQAWSQSVDDIDQWEPYHLRAVVRVHRGER
jgi:hypothetical protein